MADRGAMIGGVSDAKIGLVHLARGLCVTTSARRPAAPRVREGVQHAFGLGPVDPSSSSDAAVSVTTVARHLDIPWGVTFLPDGGEDG